MTEPIVTDEMLVGACRKFFGETWNFAEVEDMRDALEAALWVQPKPQLTEEERDAVERLRALGTITHKIVVSAIDRLTGREP